METKDENVSVESDEEFFRKEEFLFRDYSQGLPVTFRRGNGWAIDPEKGDATYDPQFFTDRGYSRAQAIFASLHEIDHFVEESKMRKSKEGKQKMAERKGRFLQKRRMQILDNCLKDAANNRRVLGKAPALASEMERLYREKLFPETDLRKSPRHLQLAYATLRSTMLPEESLEVDPLVQEAINRLKSVKGKSGISRDVLAIVTDPKVDLLTKIKLIEKFIEPEYEKLFEKDKENKQEQRGKSDQSGDTSGDLEAEFNDEYDDYEKNNPQPMSEEDAEKVITGAGMGTDAGSRQAAGYEKEHGVSLEDLADYRTEYLKVAAEVEKMRAQFRKIIEERLIPKRKLRGFKDEGVIVAPGLAAQAIIDLQRGIVDSPVFMDFEGRVERENVPAAFELTAVLDRSSSMDSGGKKEEQRRAAILLMEALREFMNEPEVGYGLIDPEMKASSEIRSFGGLNENVIIKPLSPELNEKQRVEVFKTLGTCPGSSTDDYIVLGQILDEMKAKGTEYLNKVKTRRVKKLVVIFSDGASSNQVEYDRRQRELAEVGVKVVDYRRIKDGTNFTSKMAEILAEALEDLCYNRNRK